MKRHKNHTEGCLQCDDLVVGKRVARVVCRVPAAALAGGVDFPFDDGDDGLVAGVELLGLGLAALVALFFYQLHPRQFIRKVTVGLQTYVAATNRWASG